MPGRKGKGGPKPNINLKLVRPTRRPLRTSWLRPYQRPTNSTPAPIALARRQRSQSSSGAAINSMKTRLSQGHGLRESPSLE